MVRGPAEPPRVVAARPEAAQPARKPRRPVVAQAPAPRRIAQRPVRAADVFGEPGLMTPRPESTGRTHGWW